jgi:hypothetical protein
MLGMGKNARLKDGREVVGRHLVDIRLGGEDCQ